MWSAAGPARWVCSGFGSLTSLFIGLSDLFLESIDHGSEIPHRDRGGDGVRLGGRLIAFDTDVVGARSSSTPVPTTELLPDRPPAVTSALGAGSGVLMAFALVFYFTGIQRSSDRLLG